LVDEFNILVAGVGGQGALLSSRILSQAAVGEGQRVVCGEIHGMAQRGGSITVHVRIGERVHGPIIPLGRAQVLLGLELIEPLRYMGYVSPQGLVVMSTSLVVPPSVWTTKGASYPSKEEVTWRVASFVRRLVTIDSMAIARRAGNPLAANVVMLGALAEVVALPFSREALLAAVKENTPPKELKANLKAFRLGAEEAKAVAE